MLTISEKFYSYGEQPSIRSLPSADNNFQALATSWLRAFTVRLKFPCNQIPKLHCTAVMTPEEEKALIDRIQREPHAFGEIFDRFYKPIFGYVCRRVLDYDLAKDITAETFMKAFINVHGFKWKGIPVSAWLYKIATNEVNLYFRNSRYKRQTFERIFDLDAVEKLPAEQSITEKEMWESAFRQQQEFLEIYHALKTLEIKYQEVLALRYFEHKDNHEIATILNKPEGTVKSLLSRGLEKLKKKINAEPQPKSKHALDM